MGGRTIPVECPHGAVVDWGDFGPDDADRCDECDRDRLAWTEDVDVRNAALHAVETITGRRAEPYDVHALIGSLMGDGMKIVKESRG